MKIITNRSMIDSIAVLHPDFFPMNIEHNVHVLVDKMHPDFEKYRTKAIAYSTRIGDDARINKYKNY